MPGAAVMGGGFYTHTRYTGVSIFDLRVNGQPLFVNSQQMKATNDAD